MFQVPCPLQETPFHVVQAGKSLKRQVFTGLPAAISTAADQDHFLIRIHLPPHQGQPTQGNQTGTGNPSGVELLILPHIDEMEVFPASNRRFTSAADMFFQVDILRSPPLINTPMGILRGKKRSNPL